MGADVLGINSKTPQVEIELDSEQNEHRSTPASNPSDLNEVRAERRRYVKHPLKVERARGALNKFPPQCSFRAE